MNLPFLLLSDKCGNLYQHPYLRMAVSFLDGFALPDKAELIEMPQGSTVFYLPGRLAVGFNPSNNSFEAVKEFDGKEVFAAAAFLIPAYLRLRLPAAIISQKKDMPLWAYCACGAYAGKTFVTAARIDPRVRQSPRFYDKKLIFKSAREFLKQYPKNRLYRHLANCAINYNCLAAKNLLMKRWEAPLPTARACNARCLGCLSLQEDSCISSSHQRIDFAPDKFELAQVMINHLKVANDPLVSFGQGCEGEPLMESKTISEAIELVRKETHRGTINMNTNGSLPKSLEVLCRSGIDSFRISLNSPQEKFYNLYFRPKGYKFRDVLRSIETAKKYKKFVSINLFVFPGFTDDESQVESLIKLVRDYDIDMIQWRNLNIDPIHYLELLSGNNFKPLGVLNTVNILRKKFSRLKHGYFNLCLNK
jgi:pyruvate-formate lyase-activating enzyme